MRIRAVHLSEVKQIAIRILEPFSRESEGL